MPDTIVGDSQAQKEGTVTAFRHTAGRKTNRLNKNYTEKYVNVNGGKMLL